jgi:hypothetical protein
MMMMVMIWRMIRVSLKTPTIKVESVSRSNASCITAHCIASFSHGILLYYLALVKFKLPYCQKRRFIFSWTLKSGN